MYHQHYCLPWSTATKISTYHLPNYVFTGDSNSSHYLVYLNSTWTLKSTLNSTFLSFPTILMHVRSDFLCHLLTSMPYLVLTLLAYVIYNCTYLLSPARFCSQWLSQSTKSSVFLGPWSNLAAPALDSHSILYMTIPCYTMLVDPYLLALLLIAVFSK